MTRCTGLGGRPESSPPAGPDRCTWLLVSRASRRRTTKARNSRRARRADSSRASRPVGTRSASRGERRGSSRSKRNAAKVLLKGRGCHRRCDLPPHLQASVGSFRARPNEFVYNRLLRGRPKDGYFPSEKPDGTWQLLDPGILEVTLWQDVRVRFRRERHIAMGWWTAWYDVLRTDGHCPICSVRKPAENVTEEDATAQDPVLRTR